MHRGNPLVAGEPTSGAQDDLRQRIADLLLERMETITADTVAIFPYSDVDNLDADYCRRVGRQLAQLLAIAIRDGHVDPTGQFVADLHRTALERGLAVERLFSFAYLTERTTADEIALDHRFGATSEAWPLAAQLVRRGSFDVLAAYVERTQLDPSAAAITDKLTTLHTRALFDTVLAKEVQRAARFGYPISLILFDVDHLSAINQKHGYGAGNKILERLGILIRSYFRQHDWVGRHSEDSIAVLLALTGADRASDLAERVRSTVEERLSFVDHLTENPVPVTISAVVINVTIAVGEVIDTERLMADAEAGLARAKRQGRNRLERVDGYSGTAASRLPT